MSWTPMVGYWGSTFLYTLSPIFALVHMAAPRAEGGLATVSYAEDYANDIFLMSVGMLGWAFSTVTHLLYTDRYVAHIRANYPTLFPDVEVGYVICEFPNRMDTQARGKNWYGSRVCNDDDETL